MAKPLVRFYYDQMHIFMFSGGIEKLIMMDSSVDMVNLCKLAEKSSPNKNVETSFIVGDEEFMPVKERFAQCFLLSCSSYDIVTLSSSRP